MNYMSVVRRSTMAKTPEQLDRIIEFVRNDLGGKPMATNTRCYRCEYFCGDCSNDPQLSDYCPLYNAITGEHYPKEAK